MQVNFWKIWLKLIVGQVRDSSIIEIDDKFGHHEISRNIYRDYHTYLLKPKMRRTDNPSEDLQMTEIISHYSII
jgi:hypothetical protein